MYETMPEYNERFPVYGRDTVTEIVPVPSQSPPGVTLPPAVREAPSSHDSELSTTLTMLAAEVKKLSEAQAIGSARPVEVQQDTTIGAVLTTGQKAWKVGRWIIGLVVVVFSAGMTWAVLLGENAMDSEVEGAVFEHNGVNPMMKDPDSGLPVGTHPDLRKAIQLNAKGINQNGEAIKAIKSTTGKLDKRSEYQFELQRYESRVLEAKRKRKAVPPKPQKLDKLETDLMLGNYGNQ